MNQQTSIQNISTISTEQLQNAVENLEGTIIDIRSIDAYNGWRLQNEKRGGHVKGAKSLPLKWSQYLDWIEIVYDKNIQKDDSLIIYGYEENNSKKIASLFRRAGYKKVSIYPHFINEWSAESSLPMEHLQRYHHLVPAAWLHELITTATAPEYNNSNYVLCHAHYQNQEDYNKGHIPNAISLDTNWLESTETWNRRTPEELTQLFQKLGITTDTTVIVYGRFSQPDNTDAFPGSSAGHLGAIRCAFILLYAGVKDVRILNGGLQSWIDEGYETTTKPYQPIPVTDFGATIPLHPELAIDTPEAKEYLSASDKNLVSVRSWREFIGDVSGYHYIEKKGRIPGAIFGNCGSDAYHMENYRNLDHTMKEYHEIEEIWKKQGITADNYNAFYCGTGWRASEAFFHAWLMGWKHISVYDGGWFEWTNQKNPYETGMPNHK